MACSAPLMVVGCWTMDYGPWTMLDRWMGAGQIATPSPQDAPEQDRNLYGNLDSISGYTEESQISHSLQPRN